MTPIPVWKKDVRRWARDLGADRAVVDGVGYRKRLIISACVAAVERVHGGDGSLEARIKPDGLTVVIGRPAGKMLATLTSPTRRVPDGFDERGRQLWQHIPCGVSP